MATGWGEAGARGDWYANQNFNFRNLTVQKGEKLPSAWQLPQNAKYLQTTYGETCITYKSQTKASASRRKQEDVEEWVPARKDVTRGKKGK